MNLTISGHHLDVTPALRAYVTTKLDRITRHFDQVVDVKVLLTIDNSDGALPIEYSEVTISRTLFRNGGSEYAINKQPCRLLDVQELLSDSGLGREMHVIVGQGQLDQVLHASPEDRRRFIEEAAGILKHRRRKEKTQRKLESMQANLTRLNDLAGEITGHSFFCL